MENNDSIRLLRECDSGTKMAVSSINEVLEKIQDSNMKRLLTESKDHHEKLGNEIHSLLLQRGSDEKDPAPMAKGMSWMKTNMKMAMDESDPAVADLITGGCDMGIKTLYQYLNQYQAADTVSKDICRRLISIEEQLRSALHSYL